MRDTYRSVAIALCLIGLAVVLRLLPHPANFAPVAAVAVFGGAVLPRRLALVVPLGAMVASDLVIGFYHIMPIVWAYYVAIALASSFWLAKPGFVRGAVLTLASSTFFFVVTNFAVWLFDGMYPHTYAGLLACYYMALPFFRNTFLSDLVYTGALFGIYTLARYEVGKRTAASEL